MYVERFTIKKSETFFLKQYGTHLLMTDLAINENCFYEVLSSRVLLAP